MSPFEPAVCVETNWILDIAFGRDRFSAGILQRARDGSLDVFLPSFCLAESIKSLENHRRVWNRLRDELALQRRQLTAWSEIQFDPDPSEQAEQTLTRSSDAATARFWATLAEVHAHCRLIEIDPEIIGRSRANMVQLKLSAGDALVLAAVELLSQRGWCRSFISKDKDAFALVDKRGSPRKPELLEYYRRHGITYYASAEEFFEALGGTRPPNQT